jgi:hypothetical protein
MAQPRARRHDARAAGRLMADWPTIASLATAGGTLLLAVATFSAVRSGQRSAKIAERALLIGLRPVLVPSRLTDAPEEVRFVDGRVVSVGGGMGAAERDGDSYYFVIPLRNVGTGLAALHAWHVSAEQPSADSGHADLEDFRPQLLDLYVPAGDTGYWQGAIRQPGGALTDEIGEALRGGEMLSVDLLYGDHEGGQRTITRFILVVEGDGQRRCRVVRHWVLEGASPRGR